MAKLKNIAEIRSNLMTSRNISVKNPVDVKELKIGMIKSRTSIENTNEMAQQESSRIFPLEQYDIILKRVSPVFASIVSEKTDLVLGSNLTCIRINEENKNEFYAPYLAAYIDYKLQTLIRQDSVMPVLMMEALKKLEIPQINFAKQEIIGDSWLLNDSLYMVERALIEEKHNYNYNLILKNLEAI